MYITRIMKKVKLEIFVESECKACVGALYSVRKLQSQMPLDVNVYRREKDSAIFRERKVVITPAIFIEGVLTFYGEVSPDTIKKRIDSVCYG